MEKAPESGVSTVRRLSIVESILVDIGLFRCLVFSWVSFGKLHLLKNLSIYFYYYYGKKT